MTVLGLCCFARAFSSSRVRPLLCCGTRLLICGGLTCCGARAQGVQAFLVAPPGRWSPVSAVVARGLSCSAACGIFLDRTIVSCIARWILIHFPAREVPIEIFLIGLLGIYVSSLVKCRFMTFVYFPFGVFVFSLFYAVFILYI